MKKLTGCANPKEWEEGIEGFRGITLYEAVAKGDSPALLLVSEEGEGSIEVMTRQEVQSLLIDMYNAAMDGPYIANSEAMRKVATKNKFTL